MHVVYSVTGKFLRFYHVSKIKEPCLIFFFFCYSSFQEQFSNASVSVTRYGTKTVLQEQLSGVSKTYFDAFVTLPQEVSSDSISSEIALNSKVVF